jgi:hypothetical protein
MELVVRPVLCARGSALWCQELSETAVLLLVVQMSDSVGEERLSCVHTTAWTMPPWLVCCLRSLVL